MILASQSPRRRELIALISPEFRVIPAQGEELLPEGISPEQAVLLLSRQKADEVRQREFPGGGAVPETIVAADTVVAIDGEILGKPHSAENAAEMLRRLSGRERIMSHILSVALGTASERIASLISLSFPSSPRSSRTVSRSDCASNSPSRNTFAPPAFSRTRAFFS